MKVVLYNAITVNGYIAGKDDDTSWTSEEDWESFRSTARKAGNVVIGRRTYDLMASSGELIEGCLHVVLTSDTSRKSEDSNVVFIDGGPKQALEYLERKGFSEVCVAGGGRLNGSFMKEGLVDDVYVDVEPVILGQGIQLFALGDFYFDLELVEVKKLNDNTVQLHYRVKK